MVNTNMDFKVFLLQLLFNLTVAIMQTAPEAPKFQQGNNTEVIVRPKGSILRLRCSVTANPPAVVKWFREGAKVVVRRPRIRQRSGSNYNILVVKEVGPLDSGEYVCVANNRHGEANKTYSVSVVEARLLQPSSVFVEPPQLDVTCGSTAQFKCKYHSEFSTHVQWLLELLPNTSYNYDIHSMLSVKSQPYVVLPNSAADDNVLLIKNVTMQHNGRIVCLSANSFGYARNNTLVRVLPQEGLPKFITELEPLTVQTTARNFTLHCSAKVPYDMGYYIEWVKEGQPVDPEVFFFELRNQTKHMNACVDEIRSTIIFSPLVEGHWLLAKDGGIYSCLIKSVAGTTMAYDQTTVTFEKTRAQRLNTEAGMEELARIESLTPEHVTIQEGDSVSFYCQTSGKSPSVVWLVKPDATVPVCDVRHTLEIDYITYRLIGPGEMWSRDEDDHLNILRINNLSKEHAGIYLCYEIQSSTKRETSLTVLPRQEGPIIIPPFLGNRTSLVGEKVVLECRAKSDAKPVIEWYRVVDDGYDLSETTSFMDNTVILLNVDHDVWETGGSYLGTHEFQDGVLLSDQGMYICVWSNSNGKDADQGYLRVHQFVAKN